MVVVVVVVVIVVVDMLLYLVGVFWFFLVKCSVDS